MTLIDIFVERDSCKYVNVFLIRLNSQQEIWNLIQICGFPIFIERHLFELFN